MKVLTHGLTIGLLLSMGIFAAVFGENKTTRVCGALWIVVSIADIFVGAM